MELKIDYSEEIVLRKLQGMFRPEIGLHPPEFDDLFSTVDLGPFVALDPEVNLAPSAANPTEPQIQHPVFSMT